MGVCTQDRVTVAVHLLYYGLVHSTVFYSLWSVKTWQWTCQQLWQMLTGRV